MLIQTLVFGRQDRVFHGLGDPPDLHNPPPLFAEFADQYSISRVDAQRNFRLIVGKYLKRWQIRISYDRGKAKQQRARKCQQHDQCRGNEPPARKHQTESQKVSAEATELRARERVMRAESEGRNVMGML